MAGSRFPPLRPLVQMPRAMIWDRLFHGRFEDREYAISVFNQHVEQVKAAVPPEKLLVFDVKEGLEAIAKTTRILYHEIGP